jgi:hypothetical protein
VYQPIQAVCADLQVPARLFEEDRKQHARDSTHSEQEFRSLLEGHVDRVEWRNRSTLRPLAGELAHEARSADLVLVGAAGEQADKTRVPDICDLVMNIGRPVLIVPANAVDTTGKRVLVGWKDTRETHRAIADAMPLLRTAEDVVLASIATPGELPESARQMTEVNAWLTRHQVKARTMALPARGANAGQFVGLADEIDAGLVVAGAYGYVRQSLWMIGGVTAELMHRPKRLTLLSH